jgi:DNA-binding transcriptional ArsR family regulator
MDVLDDTCAALAHPVRRELLERLRNGPRALGALAEGLPMSRPAVSQHMKLLLDAGLVSVRREGRHQIYALQSGHLIALRSYLERQWDNVLTAFANAAHNTTTGET